MAHLLLLHAQVLLEGVLRRNLRRHAFGHADSCGLQRRYFVGIIRDQAHRIDAHLPQNLRRQLKFPAVRLEAQPQIRFHRVQSLILQFVSAQLGHQADAASLLLLVNQDARTGLGNLAQRQLQLQTAIAAQRMEHVARQALRMDAHQRRRRMNVAHHQRNRFLFLRCGVASVARRLRRVHALEAEDTEMSPARGKIRVRNFAHRSDRHNPIIEAGGWPLLC